MIVNDILNELRHESRLNKLVRSGLVNTSVLVWHDIYLTYDKLCKTGLKSSEAVTECARKFRRSERAIYKAIKICQSNI
jgi:hypothetical protein